MMENHPPLRSRGWYGLLPALPLLLLVLISCRTTSSSSRDASPVPPGNRYARYFELIPGGVVTISPQGEGDRDTLMVPEGGLGRIVCMSSSYIGYLDAIGEARRVCAVSGKGFVSCMEVADDPHVYDVGYDGELDYERILSLRPDVLLTYDVGGVEAPYVSRLRSLGVRVLVLSEHLEQDPLGRSEYVRFFGALTGKVQEADSAFSQVRRNYLSLRRSVAPSSRVKVLINAPYSGLWYIPGADSYMATLIGDAGGEVLGAEEGTSRSGVISVEEAYVLSGEADVWLHPSSCATRKQVMGLNPMFPRFRIPRIYNNTRRMTPAGGNDFYESGAFRCDLILSDLVAIFWGGPASLHYYVEVE